VKLGQRAIFFAIIIIPIFLKSEELKDVLKDAFNFYPDIEKSRTELKIQKKI